MASLAANGRNRLVARLSLLSAAPLEVTFVGAADGLHGGSARLHGRGYTMKRTMIAAALAAAAIGGASSAQTSATLDNGVYSPRRDAQPLRPAAYRRHTCVARSRLAVGYWTTTSVAGAKLGALRQCAARTPRGLLCLVVSCS
jgi:hypothetical protein